jgi:hypothetical protein
MAVVVAAVVVVAQCAEVSGRAHLAVDTALGSPSLELHIAHGTIVDTARGVEQ